MANKFGFASGGATSTTTRTSSKKSTGNLLKDAGNVVDTFTNTVNKVSGINQAVGTAKSTKWTTWAPIVGIFTAAATGIATLVREGRPLIERGMDLGHKKEMDKRKRLDESVERSFGRMNRRRKEEPLNKPREACSTDGECINLAGNMTGYDCDINEDTGRRTCKRKVDGKSFEEKKTIH